MVNLADYTMLPWLQQALVKFNSTLYEPWAVGVYATCWCSEVYDIPPPVINLAPPQISHLHILAMSVTVTLYNFLMQSGRMKLFVSGHGTLQCIW